MGNETFSAIISSQFFIVPITILIILIILRVALRFNDKLFEKITINIKNSNASSNITYVPFLRHAVKAILYFITAIAITQNIPGFNSVASALLASTGVLTVVIGFASQEAMSNIVSGIMILAFRPFSIGDLINYNGTVGTVEEISLRHTIIKTLENKRLIVPNSSMNSNVVENANFNESKICVFLEIGISYESSIDKAREIILNHCIMHKDYFDNRTEEDKEKGVPKVVIRVVELGESSVNLKAWVWAKDGGTGFAMKCDLLESIKKEFDKSGIEIPYPQLTISNK